MENDTKNKTKCEEKLYRAQDPEGHGKNNNTENRTEQGNTRLKNEKLSGTTVA